MKKITLFSLLLLLTSYSFAQCPNFVSATAFNITFDDGDNNGIPDSFNDCSAMFPQNITVDGKNFGRGGCGPSQLSYSNQSGSAIDPTNFTVDFGGSIGVCAYVNGQTLSTTNFDLNQVEIFPNPISNEADLIVKFPKQDNYSVTILNVLGKTVYSQQHLNVLDININTNTLAVGLYILKISTDTSVLNKKIVVQ